MSAIGEDTGDSTGSLSSTDAVSRAVAALPAGRWRVIRELGRGGMGVVLEVEDLRVGRRVAVKVLPPEMIADADQMARFRAEAKAAARVVHPNVVTLYSVEREGDAAWLVMELVRGGTLEQRLKRSGPLHWREAATVLAAACDGVAAAHRAGLVHRDLKPGNILLVAAGGSEGSVAKVADFGLSKPADGRTRSLTGLGEVLGTPAYMAPEQARSEAADARSDVYSLGATLFAAIAGQSPYHDAGGPLPMMFAHCNMPVPDLLAVVPDMPPALADVVSRAMAKERADRFASAEEMAGAIRTAAGLDMPVARPIPGGNLSTTGRSMSGSMSGTPSGSSSVAARSGATRRQTATSMAAPATPAGAGGMGGWALPAGLAAGLIVLATVLVLAKSAKGPAPDVKDATAARPPVTKPPSDEAAARDRPEDELPPPPLHSEPAPKSDPAGPKKDGPAGKTPPDPKKGAPPWTGYVRAWVEDFEAGLSRGWMLVERVDAADHTIDGGVFRNGGRSLRIRSTRVVDDSKHISRIAKMTDCHGESISVRFSVRHEPATATDGRPLRPWSVGFRGNLSGGARVRDLVIGRSEADRRWADVLVRQDLFAECRVLTVWIDGRCVDVKSTQKWAKDQYPAYIELVGGDGLTWFDDVSMYKDEPPAEGGPDELLAWRDALERMFVKLAPDSPARFRELANRWEGSKVRLLGELRLAALRLADAKPPAQPVDPEIK